MMEKKGFIIRCRKCKSTNVAIGFTKMPPGTPVRTMQDVRLIDAVGLVCVRCGAYDSYMPENLIEFQKEPDASAGELQKAEPYWTPHKRMDGRMEWDCPHGVGHGNHIHGCCEEGCCSRKDFPGRKK